MRSGRPLCRCASKAIPTFPKAQERCDLGINRRWFPFSAHDPVTRKAVSFQCPTYGCNSCKPFAAHGLVSDYAVNRNRRQAFRSTLPNVKTSVQFAWMLGLSLFANYWVFRIKPLKVLYFLKQGAESGRKRRGSWNTFISGPAKEPKRMVEKASELE